MPTQPLEGGAFPGRDEVSAGAPCYRVDLPRVRLRELWHLSGPAAFPVAVISYKVLRNSLPVRDATVLPERLILFGPDDIPEALAALRAPLLAACEEAGFRHLFDYRLPSVRRHGIGLGGFHLNGDGSIAAVVLAVEHRTPVKTLRRVVLAFSTRCVGGRQVSTVNQRRRFDPPPESDVEYFPGTAPGALLVRHRERIAALAPAEIAPIRPEEAEAYALATERRWVEHQIERGILVPLTEAERAQLFGWDGGDAKPAWGLASLKAFLFWIVVFSLAILLFDLL